MKMIFIFMNIIIHAMIYMKLSAQRKNLLKLRERKNVKKFAVFMIYY